MNRKNTRVGRPCKPYRTTWGEYINGLRKRGDGRWQIVTTGATFVEDDERLAVARFRRWESDHQGLSVPHSGETIAEVQFKQQPNGKYTVRAKKLQSVSEIPEGELWAWFREQLISRPEYAAQQTGIPELSRLADLPRSEPSPTLKSLGKLYQEHSEAKPKQVRQVALFWSRFQQWMAGQDVKTLNQLTPALLAAYGDSEKAIARGKRDGGKEGGSLVYLKHRFNAIKGVFNFARKRGVNATDLRHALDCCAVLEVSKHRRMLAPHPISRADFHTLLGQATDPCMRAFLLVMLNCCMYPSEALALDWGELNLEAATLTTSRNKTKIIRIGVLWRETIEAIELLRPDVPAPHDQPIFMSREATRWSTKTATNQFRRLRKEVGIDHSVKCADFRDGAYTAAIDSGADLTQTKLLAGHATGISDHYTMRKPMMVRNAIMGIYRAYFGENAQG
ncbi:MAG: tyrosine-type recombinase/integrase [Planctomycetota bacterium]